MSDGTSSRRTSRSSVGNGSGPATASASRTKDNVACRSAASSVATCPERYDERHIDTSSGLAHPRRQRKSTQEVTVVGVSDRQISRNDFLRKGAVGGAFGLAALAVPGLAKADPPNNEQVAEIYELQAAFHRAKSTQDIDLMMSLWAVDGKLTNQNDPNSPYIGAAQLSAFWLSSGSFTHRRFSLVPSFKTQIDVHGNDAWLYF